jgi:hypothetical protein
VQKETPTRIFISHVNREPDLTLARDLHAKITRAGHYCFLATESLRLGDNWSERIDSELRQCDYFLVLLSRASSASDMVVEEVERAKKLYKRQHGRPRILTVRVRLSENEAIGYRVASYLNPFQRIGWQSEGDTARVLDAILGTVTVAAESIPPTRIPSSSTRIGLTVSLHQSCVQVLKDCWELKDRHTLEPLFGIDPLSRYRNAIPLEAQSQVQLIETVVHNLVSYPATNGKPLLELLSVLRDKRDHSAPEWESLDQLWTQVNLYLDSKLTE